MEKGTKVLIVDDDSFLLDMYALKFKEGGFEVDTSPSAEDALRKLREGKKPHVLILDLVMPGVDGFALLESMQKEKLSEGVTTIVLSNLDQEADRMKAKERGISGYIVKADMVPSEVVAKVSEIVAGNKQ